MTKNIVVCCDGTANEFARDRTNVVKLYSTLVQDRERQVAYYHPGLGTMEPPGALIGIARLVTKMLGKAFGYGLQADVRDTYVFLMSVFESGDQVFLFGFSRGAYTVRAVASLLRMYGLIRKGNEPLVPYAIRMLIAINKLHQRASRRPNRKSNRAHAQRQEYFKRAAQFRRTFSVTDCKPRFVGVWDTISSVGWVGNPLRLPYTADNRDIDIGRHAISIDERRSFFRTNLWHPRLRGGPRDLKQVWFPGGFTAMLAAGTLRFRAGCRSSRSSGCCRKQRPPVCWWTPREQSACSAERGRGMFRLTPRLVCTNRSKDFGTLLKLSRKRNTIPLPEP